MKNKKLFAILTLLCFMFTLMPVAAFADTTVYAEVNEDSEIVAVDTAIKVDVTNAADNARFYVFAMKDDTVNKTLGFAPAGLIDGQIIIQAGLSQAGAYDIYVVDQSTYAQNVIKRYSASEITRNEAAALLIKESNVVMLDNDVTVKSDKASYVLTFVGAEDIAGNDVPAATKNNEEIANSMVVGADSGFDEVEVTVQLNEATYDEDGELVATGDAVVGATLDIDTNSYVIDVDKTEVKTNAAGQAKFVVTAATAGDFKVYVEYGNRTDLELFVKAGALDPAAITTTNQPTAPIALDSEVEEANIRFGITDANGNSVNDGLVAGDNYRVIVTEAPAGAVLAKATVDNLSLVMTAKGWELQAVDGFDFDEEGDYTFKVILENGAYAIAKVSVKEFQSPVALKLVYPTNAIELSGSLSYSDLVYVDANGVTKDAANTVELSATGYAVKDFTAKEGKVEVKQDEKYVGSKITVLAVSEKYNLVASAELVVANEAAAVKYATTTADVALNNTLVANVVDIDGNKVALNETLADNAEYQIQYIVLDKPADSKVAISTKSTTDFANKGQFTVSFTASAIGEYKVQTVVRVTDEDEVVKYYSGTETITVGNTGVEDVVVMSINSNEIVVNSDIKEIDAAPIVENNRTFVPFRALAEAFGATVAYDEATQAVTAELNGTTVVMTIGSATYTVNGAEKTADVAPFINGSRTMVPVRFVAEAFGINVTPTYDDNGATADILFAK